MVKISRIFIALCVFCVCAPLSWLSADAGLPLDETGPDREVLISMDFKDADLKEILKVFSIQSGLNFIASEALQDRKMTLYLEKVPLGMAMDELFKANNLSYDLDKKANIFIVKEWGDLGPELSTRIFFLKYASVNSSSIKGEAKGLSSSGSGGGGLTATIMKLLSSSGNLVEDPRTNSIIVTDVPSRLDTVAQVIVALDVSIPQVLIEVEMLDVSKTTVDKLGISWPETLATLSVTGTRDTSLPFFGGKAFGHFGPPSVLSVLNAEYALDFFRSQTDSKSLARPKILTLSGETAEVRISTEEAIGSSAASTSVTTSTGIERATTGVLLRVTPQVNLETGEITMFVAPSVSVAAPGIVIGNTNTKDPETRGTKSMVRVRDGETIVLGGLIKTERKETKTSVPGFSKLPIVGALFRHTERPDDSNKDRELLIFLTTHIVNDSEMKRAGVAPAKIKKLAAGQREQSALAGMSRQAAVGSYLNNFERSAQ